MAYVRLWWRSRIEAAAVVVVCTALIAIGILEGRVSAQVDSALDENWRGLYDILVTEPSQDFGADSTGGLVDANFVSTAGEGGISADQLQSIRNLTNVDVAAPVGMVGALRSIALTPSIWVTDDPMSGVSSIGSTPELFRIASTLSRVGSDGDDLISRNAGVLGLSQRSDTDPFGDLSSNAVASPVGFNPQQTSLSYQIPLGMLPDFASTVIAIDPEAEMKLLGEDGSYLLPLASVLSDRNVTSAGADWGEEVDGSRYLVQQVAIQTAASKSTSTAQVVPLLVNDSPSTSLSLSVSIDRGGSIEELPNSGTALDAEVEERDFAPWQTLTKDVSDLTIPFSSPDLTLVWPGDSLPAGESGGVFSIPSTTLQPFLVGRPAYQASNRSLADDDGLKFEVTPVGVVAADGLPVQADPLYGADENVGLNQAYRSFTEAGGPGFSSALPAPVGTFTVSDITSQDTEAPSYVPSGIFDGAQTEFIASPDGNGLSTPRDIVPNLSALDFVTQPPGALTDLSGGQSLRGSTPIDAVRVRVAGVDAYTEENQSKVASVAGQIAEMGLTATVVAGSSPQPVAVYVPEYTVDGQNRAADLGWVRQDWTTLGATVTVTSAINVLQYSLVFSGLAVVILALFASVLLTGRLRRQEVVVLRDHGWTRNEIKRRLWSRQIPGVLIITAVAATTFLFGTRETASTLGSALVVFGGGVGAFLSVAVSQRADKPRRRRDRARLISTVNSLALRHVKTSPATALAQAGGLALAGVSAALTVAVLSDARQQSGSTRIAEIVFDQSGVSTILLGVAGTAGALLLALLGRRSDIKRHKAETVTLRSIGYRPKQIQQMHVTEGLVIGVAGLAIGVLGVIAISLTTGAGINAVIGGIAVLIVVGISTSLVPSTTGAE